MNGTNVLERKNSAMMASDLARSLVDNMMMSRYGTSLEIGMTREYQKYIDQKYQILKAEFDVIDKDSDDLISLDELIVFFSKYSQETNKSYDRKYIEKCFKIMDKDSNSTITM